MRYVFAGTQEVTDNIRVYSESEKIVFPQDGEPTEHWKERLRYTRLSWELNGVRAYRRDEPESPFVRIWDEKKQKLGETYMKLYSPPLPFAVIGTLESWSGKDEYIFLARGRMETIELQHLWVPSEIAELQRDLERLKTDVAKLLHPAVPKKGKK